MKVGWWSCAALKAPFEILDSNRTPLPGGKWWRDCCIHCHTEKKKNYCEFNFHCVSFFFLPSKAEKHEPCFNGLKTNLKIAIKIFLETSKWEKKNLSSTAKRFFTRTHRVDAMFKVTWPLYCQRKWCIMNRRRSRQNIKYHMNYDLHTSHYSKENGYKLYFAQISLISLSFHERNVMRLG